MTVALQRACLPHQPGVYRFRDGRGQVLYIGRAGDVRKRVSSYWSNLGNRPRLARMVARIARIEAVVCDSEHEAAWLERNLIEQAPPRWNRVEGGLGVAVYIRLKGPRVSVVHDAELEGTYFGPYLGGGRVRMAVDALRRVIPLEYATPHQGGSVSDFARIRGVAPGSLASLVDTLTAALDRDPLAVQHVRQHLMDQRDRAAEHLDFEHAARIQLEIESFDWVVSEQKVTTRSACNQDLYGWSDGILLHFAMRAGRITEFTTMACGEAAAQGRVATTPEGWTAFAERNAQLGAALSTAGIRNERHNPRR